MSWWRNRKIPGKAEKVEREAWSQQQDHSPIDSMALTQSRKRFIHGDSCLPETRASSAEAMLTTLINRQLATLNYLQRVVVNPKRQRVDEQRQAPALPKPSPTSRLPLIMARRRQVNMLDENYREARSHWIQEGVFDAASMRIRQIVLLSGDDCESPTWQWPSGTKVFRVAYPSSPVSGSDSDDADYLGTKLWEGSPRIMVHVNADATRPRDLSRRLAAAGFRPAARSLIIAEGLQYLLAEDIMEDLLSEMSRLAAPGSLLLLDFLHQEVLAHWLSGKGDIPKAFPAAQQAYVAAGRPMLSGLPSEPDTIKFVLTPHGFHPLELLNPGDIAKRFVPQQARSRRLPPWHSFISAQKLRHTALFTDSNLRDVSPFGAAWRK